MPRNLSILLSSQEVQDTLGTTTTNRPVRKNAKNERKYETN